MITEKTGQRKFKGRVKSISHTFLPMCTSGPERLFLKEVPALPYGAGTIQGPNGVLFREAHFDTVYHTLVQHRSTDSGGIELVKLHANPCLMLYGHFLRLPQTLCLQQNHLIDARVVSTQLLSNGTHRSHTSMARVIRLRRLWPTERASETK